MKALETLWFTMQVLLTLVNINETHTYIIISYV